MADLVRLSGHVMPAATSPERRVNLAHRQEPRREARTSVTVITNTDGRIPCRLSNITPHGCSLKSDTANFRLGQFITIKLTQQNSVGGIVRWVRSNRAGVEFLRQIPSALVDLHVR